MDRFVHLHLHSEYSLLDGACRIKDIPKFAKALGQTAVALTDHGNMFGAVEFYKACKSEGIKPIIGCEVYVAPGSRFERTKINNRAYYHLVLLAKNEIGYKNLSFLVSCGYTEGFYVKPRIDMELLRDHSEGLIALSACLSGYIPLSVLRGDIDGAIENIKEMQSIFGKDNFYLEFQQHGISEEKNVNDVLLELAHKTGTEVVCTNDVHYIRKDDAYIQSILMAIQTNTTVEDNKGLAFPTSEFYLKSRAEMEENFPGFEKGLENTLKIADMCNFEFEFGQQKLPVYPLPENVASKDFLRNLAYNGFKEKKESKKIIFNSLHTEEEYIKRLEYELSVIDKMGYNDYFLIVWDFIRFAKDSKIPVGPGRGSGAGSFVAYLLGITDVDSIKFDLLFERFLNVERVSMPDIDTDFCYERRDEVIDYVKRKYGSDHVAQIVTFGTMAAKAAIKDVGRVLNIPYSDVDTVSKLISRRLNITIKEALSESAELKKLYDNDNMIKKMIDIAMSIEGMPRHASTHAAGVVITDKPMVEYLPLAVNGDMVVTQYDMDTVADLGILKFDFLALRYLTIISNTEKLIKEKIKDFDIEKIPLDDKETYKFIASGKTDGVFQLESEGIKQVLIKLQPESLDDIIACIALYRPGPMDSIPTYIERRHNKTLVSYKTPLLEDILKSTYGCIVYQEQVMQIFSKIAGYSYGRADIVRRMMSKKKTEEMKKERSTFIEGAIKNGVPEDTANDIFSEMEDFAKYAFNKSHAVAYAVTSYRTAYLKKKFPKEYYASLITSVLGNSEKMAEYTDECEKINIKVLPPDVNKSNAYFSVDEENIRFGLLAIKNVGINLISAIVENRENNGKYKDFSDFIFRLKDKDINKRQIESLIKAGAFDSLGKLRSRLLAKYEEIIDSATSISRASAHGQMDITSLMDIYDADNTMPKFEYPEIPEMPVCEMLRYEKEMCGIYFSGHVLDSYNLHLSKIKKTPIKEIIGDKNKAFSDNDKVTVCGLITSRTVKRTKNNENMAFITLDDKSAEIEVIVFPKAYEMYSDIIVIENVICVNGRISKNDDEKNKIILSKAENILQNSQYMKSGKKSRLYLKVDGIESEIVSQISDILKNFSGNVEIVFYDSLTKKYSKLNNLSISVNEEILNILKSILGENNVVLKD